MLILAICWLIFGGLFYIFSFLGYKYQWKIFVNNADAINPMLSRTNYSKNTNLLIMALAAVVGIAGAIGLWLNCLWAIILAIIVHGNEVYRGAVFYMKEGLYWEVIKHIIIHAFIIGYIVCWVIFVKYHILTYSGGISW